MTIITDNKNTRCIEEIWKYLRGKWILEKIKGIADIEYIASDINKVTLEMI